MRKAILFFFGAFFIFFLTVVIFLESEQFAQGSPQVVEPEPTEGIAVHATISVIPEVTTPVPEVQTEPTQTDPDILFVAQTMDVVFNNELQKYKPEQANVTSDHITLTADLVDGEYLSGKVESKMAFRYGTFAFRINTIKKGGLFPAIWMLPASGDQLPEVDIYESIGSEPYRFYGGIHFLNSSGIKDKAFLTFGLGTDKMEDTYVLRFEWTEETMQWYVNDTPVGGIWHDSPNIPMYLICNLAIGGNWAGTPLDSVFPESFEIEIVEFEPVEIFAR